MNTVTTQAAAQLLAAINNSSNLEFEDEYVHITLDHDEYDSLKELLAALLLGIDE